VIEQIRRVMRPQHKSLNTEKAYLTWLRRCVEFLGWKAPEAVVDTDVTAFLTWLAVNQQVAAATQSQALNALVYCFRHGVGPELAGLDASVRPRPHRRVPDVLPESEVRRLLVHPQRRSGLVHRRSSDAEPDLPAQQRRPPASEARGWSAA
jgi:site-specific recombinase XerD